MLSLGCRFRGSTISTLNAVAAPLISQMGMVVRKLRDEAGLSQEEFAARCGLHRTYVGAIERGEKTITIETAHKLAVAFGMPMSELFRRLEKTIEDDKC